MYFSQKRQQYLVDQGYKFKVEQHLTDTADKVMMMTYIWYLISDNLSSFSFNNSRHVCLFVLFVCLCVCLFVQSIHCYVYLSFNCMWICVYEYFSSNLTSSPHPLPLTPTYQTSTLLTTLEREIRLLNEVLSFKCDSYDASEKRTKAFAEGEVDDDEEYVPSSSSSSSSASASSSMPGGMDTVGVRRKPTTLGSLSGADGTLYREFDKRWEYRGRLIPILTCPLVSLATCC